MIKIFGVTLILVAAGLAGCSTLSCGDPHPYLNSQARPPLKAPPGLDVPAPDPAYAIAGVAANSGKRTDLSAAGACLINPPQVVPSATSAGVKRAETPKSGTGVQAPAGKLAPPVKPAANGGTRAPSASTSGLAG